MAQKENEKLKYGTISLPIPLIEKIKKRMKGTGFNSVSGYVAYVLRQILTETEENAEKPALSEKNEEKVKKRLKALGYLD